ncbi:MAG TPA: pilus assembly protein PilB, partial [Thermoanaerobaculia bacterium]
MAKQTSNGKAVPDLVRFSSRAEEEAQAIALSERLGLPFVDLAAFRVDAELFRSIPVEWMLRYNFVPESRTDRAMTVICADPADVVRLDELELLVGVPLKVKVGSRAAIADLL